MSKRTREQWRRRQRGPPRAPVPPIAEVQGGSGGQRAPDAPVDVGLAARALRHGWAVPDRDALLAAMAAIVRDPNRKPRERATCLRAILAAEKLDLESVKVGILAREHDDLVADVEQLKRELEGHSNE